MTAPEQKQDIAEDDVAWAVEAELAFHDGDAKATIADLLEDRLHLRQQLALTESAAGHGFTRGWKPTYDRKNNA